MEEIPSGGLVFIDCFCHLVCRFYLNLYYFKSLWDSVLYVFGVLLKLYFGVKATIVQLTLYLTSFRAYVGLCTHIPYVSTLLPTRYPMS